jgi:hypothetical protein
VKMVTTTKLSSPSLCLRRRKRWRQQSYRCLLCVWEDEKGDDNKAIVAFSVFKKKKKVTTTKLSSPSLCLRRRKRWR